MRQSSIFISNYILKQVLRQQNAVVTHKPLQTC